MQRYSIIVESDKDRPNSTISAVSLDNDGNEHKVIEEIPHDEAAGMAHALQQSFGAMVNIARGQMVEAPNAQ